MFRRNFLMFVIFVCVLSINSFSQAYKTTNDSLECIIKISTYKEYVLKKYYDEAYPHWLASYNSCPASTKNIYLDGVKIYQSFIEKEKDKTKRLALIDSLMAVYDKRIAYFGQEDYVLGLKGVDLLRYNKQKFEEGYGYLLKSIKSQRNETDAAMVLTFMQSTGGMFKNGKISSQDVLENYMLCIDILEYQLFDAKKNVNTTDYLAFKNNLVQLENQKAELIETLGESGREVIDVEKEISTLKKENSYANKLAKAEMAITSTENIFTQSGAASCQVLFDIFSPKFNNNKTDVELLKKITTILDNSECNESPLFTEASEQLYKIEPSSRAAYNIAQLFVKNKDFNKAIEYYQKAISIEQDELAKADYYYQLAAVQNINKDYSNARANAQKCISLKPDWGKPYLLLGKIYAAGSSTLRSKDNIDEKAVYWLAVDKFKQAKRIDTSLAGEADKLIGTYQPFFPNKEDAFFFGVTEGQKYTVGNWINETTIVRFN